MHAMKKMHWSLLACALIALVTAGILYGARGYADQPAKNLSWDEQVTYWQSRVRDVGGSAAYDEFATFVQSMPQTQQHVRVHAFGRALFREAGEAGLSVCDTRFSYGCFHQFLGDAIASLGASAIPSLNDACFKTLVSSPLSCQHGIGHGVMGSLAYDLTSLHQALATCKELPGSDPIGGCYGGVFMEYNVRTMLGEYAEPRPFEGNPFEPCDSLDSTFVPACIYWQPQWWQQTVLRDVPLHEQFVAMDGYCAKFGTTPELKRACFEGVGNIVAQASNFDAGTARALCNAIESSSVARLFCLSIGANHFGIDVGARDAVLVCDGLSSKQYAYCLAYARNELNVANVGTPPL